MIESSFQSHLIRGYCYFHVGRVRLLRVATETIFVAFFRVRSSLQMLGIIGLSTSHHIDQR